MPYPNASRTSPRQALAITSILCSIAIALTFGSPLAMAQAVASVRQSEAANQSSRRNLPYAIHKKDNEFGIWGGSTSDSPTIIGGVKERKLPLIVGVRYGRMLSAGKRFALQYTFDLIPVAVVSQPTSTLQRTRVYGAGVFPLGFKLFFRPQHKFKPFVEISSGPVYFTRQVPRPDAARLNFISNFRGGVQIFTVKRRSVTIGYDISHLSNAGISKANPGFNMNYFYVGFSIFK